MLSVWGGIEGGGHAKASGRGVGAFTLYRDGDGEGRWKGGPGSVGIQAAFLSSQSLADTVGVPLRDPNPVLH